MRVVVITDAYQHAYVAEGAGEPLLCELIPLPPVPFDATPCLGRADIAIIYGREPRRVLNFCRVCAEGLTAQLRECLALLDARDVSGWTKP
jgi:hypothetical protein